MCWSTKQAVVNLIKTEITSNIFSENNTLRLKINYKKKKCKKHKHVEAKQYVTKQSIDHWRNQRGHQKISRDKWKHKHDGPKPMGHSKSSSKREVYSNTILLQKSQINNITLHLKQLEKEERSKTQR